MPLPSFLQRFLKRPAAPAPAAGAKPGKGKARAAAAEPASGAMGSVPSAVQAARVQARRRLVGALVLLLVGIVAFPLLFETQPRPVALDIPIQTPNGSVQAPAPVANATPARQPLPPSVVVEAPVDAPASAVGLAPVVAPASAPGPARAVGQAPLEIERELPPKPVAKASAPAVAEAKRPDPKTAEPKASGPAAARATLKPPPDDGSRARALLDDKPAASAATASPTTATPPANGAAAASAAKGGRYVVQVGAYTDTTALREARQKVEKLGLKTYTQVVEGGDAGKRTRVRVGPFETREEAERTAARVKAQGLPTAILAL
jgi:DedD protein